MTFPASPSNPDTANRLERALGITDRHGWLLGWWQSLVVGSAFVIISLIGYHSPQPRDVPLAITGTTTEVEQVEAQVAAASGGGYRFYRFGSTAAADAALRGGDMYAVVDLTDKPTIRYAGAQGPTVLAAFVRSLVPSVAAATRTSPDLVDALPLADDDAAALPLFYLCFAVVLASYLFAITTTTQARRLPMGVALTTVRDVTYFGGQHIVRGVLVLTLWALLPLLAATLWNRRARTAAPVPAGYPAATAP